MTYTRDSAIARLSRRGFLGGTLATGALVAAGCSSSSSTAKSGSSSSSSAALDSLR